MSPHRRNVALVASLAAAGAIVIFAAIFWQPIADRLRPAPPPPTDKLTIAVINTYAGSGLVLIAAAKGYFAAEGLAVTLQPHGAGATALDAVLKNKADMATVGNMPVMFATLNKAPVSIVATISSSSRGAAILARRDRGISQPADLKGKTVGVTLGTDGHFVLNVILASHGMASTAVKTEDIRPGEMLASLSAGRVDAIATWEPLLSTAKKAVAAGGVTIDLDRGFLLWFHLAGHRDFVRNHPEIMQRLLLALRRAERYVNEDSAAASAIVAKATGLDSAVFDAIWPNFSPRLTLPQGMLTMLEDQARWAIASGYTKVAEVPNFLDSIYLDAMLAVQPEMVSIVR